MNTIHIKKPGGDRALCGVDAPEESTVSVYDVKTGKRFWNCSRCGNEFWAHYRGA